MVNIENKNKNIEKCGICGDHHTTQECGIIHLKLHILDKPLIPKARLTLPDELEVCMLADGTSSVYTKCMIKKGTQFGPFQAKRSCSLLPSITFPLKIFSNNVEDLSECYLDTSDENECSWMIYIAAASNFEEQNLICFQHQSNLFYISIRDIAEGEQLKVWYSPYYALLMKRELLTPPQLQETQPIHQVDELVERNKNVAARESWSCKFCGKVENKVVDFALHLMEHYKAKMNKTCEKCGDSFLKTKDLQNHLKITHCSTTDIPQESVLAGKIKTNKSILGKNAFIKDTNVGGPLLLTDVDQESLDNSNLMLEQTVSKQLELNCFVDQYNLLENENLSFNVDSILLTDNVKELDHFNFELKESETEQLVCDLCLKSFQKLRLLIIHLAQHTGKHTCPECNKVFTRKENLQFHRCSSFYKFKCSVCDKLFYQQKTLKHHIKYSHNKDFLCHKCNKNFLCQKKLDGHSCSIVNQKSFSCNICFKQFTYKKNLSVHLKRHENGNETYNCPICNAKLNSRMTYMRHAKIHDSQGHKCEICNELFTREDALKYHIKVVHENNEQTCPLCNKILASSRQLKKHLITHQATKDHKCNQCQRCFKQKANLLRHINAVHNSSKKKENNMEHHYSCPKCETKVKFKQSLLKHMRKHHPGSEQSLKVNWRHKKSTFEHLLIKDDTELDLKQTIDNMNFLTDEINNYEAEVNSELDKLLNSATNIETFLDESNERLVDSLINIAVKDNPLLSDSSYQQRNICLSMPELTSGT